MYDLIGDITIQSKEWKSQAVGENRGTDGVASGIVGVDCGTSRVDHG